MFPKSSLLLAVIKEIEERAAKLSDAARVTHEEAVRAPTPMESHSDRTRFEMQTASSHQRAMASKYEAAIKKLKNFSLPPLVPSKAGAGSLITVERNSKESRYFLLPEGNGISVDGGETTCVVVTPDSPLGKALVGKVVGDEFTFETGHASSFLRVKALE
jgi:transcription elongation GreA/GreB family factor